jgi:hypothetical protein
MFKVGDRVRIKSNDEFDGDTGTVVLVDNTDCIVDVDNNTFIDPFVSFVTSLYGVPESSVPFELTELELLEVEK